MMVFLELNASDHINFHTHIILLLQDTMNIIHCPYNIVFIVYNDRYFFPLFVPLHSLISSVFTWEMFRSL